MYNVIRDTRDGSEIRDEDSINKHGESVYVIEAKSKGINIQINIDNEGLAKLANEINRLEKLAIIP